MKPELQNNQPVTPTHWRYQLLGELGRGATSIVYRALDLVTDNQVALKVVTAMQAEDLCREFRRLHRLSHPGLVRAYDLHLTRDHGLLSMELLETAGAFCRIQDEETWFSLWSQLASVLMHLHSRGLVHGDIKPENIGRSGDGLKLIDLGLSGKVLVSGGRIFSGTPAYAPPEMLDQGISSPAGDIYSLGLVLWEAAGGGLPAPAEKLDPSEAWLGRMPAVLPAPAAEVVRGMLRCRRFDRLEDGGQLIWAMAEAGLYREPGFAVEMSLAGRASELRRVLKAVRSGSKNIHIKARPGAGASRFLDELKRLMQLEGHEVCMASPENRRPPEAPAECWLLHDAGVNGSFLPDSICQGRSIIVSSTAAGSDLSSIELSDLDRGGYLRILHGMFRGASASDLEALAGWLEGQVGGHVAAARALLADIVSQGLIHWEKHRWEMDWQDILGLDASQSLAACWEERWQRLDGRLKQALKQAALAGYTSCDRENESDFNKLGEWLRLGQGEYRFIGQAGRGFVLDKCSAEECGLAEDEAASDGKLYPVTPALKALAKAGNWEAWLELGVNLFRKARSSGDFESAMFYGRLLAESGRLDAGGLAEVLTGTAEACRALGRFRQGLEILAVYGGSLKPDWRLVRAGMVLSIGAGQLDRAGQMARLAADAWAGDQAIRLEAGLFQWLAEGMARGRHGAEEKIAEIEAEAAGRGYSKLQLLARQFRATLAHLAGDWKAVMEHAQAGLELAGKQTDVRDVDALSSLLGNSLIQCGRAGEAEELLRKFIELYGDKLSSPEICNLNGSRGLAAIKNGNWELAYHCFKNAERHAVGEGSINLKASVSANLAIVLGARNQHRAEAENHLQSYRLYRYAGDIGNAIISLGNYGVKKKILGETAEALIILKECLEMAREQKLENVQMLAGKNLGLAEFEERQWDRSLELFRESRQAAEAAGLPPNFEAELFAALAGILSGAADLAKEKLAQAAKLASNRQQAIWIEYAEGMIMAQEGKEGLPIILEAIGRMREQGRFRDAALMALTAAESADIQDCGDPMALMSALLQAEAEFDRLGDREMRDRARQAVVSAARELAAAPGAAAGQGMLEAFYQLAFLLKSGAGPAQVGQAALEQAVKLTEAERGGLFIVSEDGRPELLSGVNLDQSTIRDAYEFSAKALGQAGREGAEVVSNDAQAEDDFRSRESVRRNAIRSLACIPLQFREGAGGALYLDSRLKPGIFSSGRRQFLRALASVVGAVLESSRLMESLRAGGEQASELDRIIGSSPPVLEMKLRIRKAAGARVNVLIEGETGTGKELAARAIHGLSDRRAKTFVALDCGSLPESLLEAELFGHIKGAFTGAHADKPGLFEAADGGTMFLDEITSASPAVQARLLRVIEEGEVRRVGDTKVRKVDVRLICAANKDMEFEIGEGRFKPDLYYRLNEFRIAIPPLRDRGNDVLILAEHFRIKHQKLQGKRGLAFSPGAKKAMAAHPWPGNIREMENAVQKAVIMAGQGTITEQDLELPAVSIQPQYESDRRKRGVTRKMLSKALKDCDYETSKAAQALGISQRQVQRLIKRFRMAT